MDIVPSSIFYTYEVNKKDNSILQVPWFHTPASNFSWHRYDTIGDIYEQKLATKYSFPIFGCIVFAHTLTEIPTKHHIKETSSKGNIWGPFYTPKGEVSGGG